MRCIGVIVIAVVLLLTGQNANAQPGVPGLARVGPIDPVHGFPMWYEDANGLILEPCLDPGSCLFSPPDPTLPASFPDNFPDEIFWWAASADIGNPDDRKIELTLALEGTFAHEEVVDGDQISFARLRIRVEGLVVGETYTVTHPFGVEVFEDIGPDGGSGIDGPGISITRDIGITVPGDFRGALLGDVGPFLTWDPIGDAPQGFVGDGLTPHAVTGSPFGTNVFRIEGPDAGGSGIDIIETDQFVVVGKLATRFGVGSPRVTYGSEPGSGAWVDVWATSASGSTLVASLDGESYVTLSADPDQIGYFGRISTASVPASTTVTLYNLSDDPVMVVHHDVEDVVVIEFAIYDADQERLEVFAHSSDAQQLPELMVEPQGWSLQNLPGGGASLIVDDLAVPPDTITVGSARGGSAVSRVSVVGSATTPELEPLAIAGLDRFVVTGETVQLIGSDSLGTISSYAWEQIDTGGIPPVVLLDDLTGAGSGANVANPYFVFPATPGPTTLLFQLTVSGGGGVVSTDTVAVTGVTPVDLSDELTMLRARYDSGRDSWRIRGTASIAVGQEIELWLGEPGTGEWIGSAVVLPNGQWRLSTPDGSGPTPPTPTPGALPGFVTAVSELGGTSTHGVEFR